MRRAEIPLGFRFGRLVVIGELPSVKGRRVIRCRCDCGAISTHRLGNLRKGDSRSCGCLCAESIRRISHGEARKNQTSPEYKVWLGINKRCFNNKEAGYKNYGGRGITVCGRWRGKDGYSNFLSDVGRRPSARHSLDRFPDNDGNYEPGNVRWATRGEQNRNTRQNVWLTIKGVTKCLGDWAAQAKVARETIRRRIAAGLSGQSLLLPSYDPRVYKPGRKAVPLECLVRGEKHASAKLTEDKVKGIRAMKVAGRSLGQLAKEFNVSKGSIAAIVKRRTWTHI